MSSTETTQAIDSFRPFVEANLSRWEELFRELIQTPSLFESEHEIIEKVKSHIEALDLEVIKVRHSREAFSGLAAAQPPLSDVDGRYSLVTRLPGTGGGSSLVINTHLDIVPEGNPEDWTYPPFSGHIDREQNVIYGRGAMDDKAGLTASLAILETLLRAPERLAGDVIFQFVLEDEITGNGSLLCLEAGHMGDAALIMDGTRTDKGIKEHAGQLQFEINLKGKPASVSVSHMGVNAAEMLSRLVLHLREAVFALNERREEPWTQFPSPYQLVLQKIYSQGAQLTVPESATAQCYMTFPPQFTLASMKQFLQEQVDGFADAHVLPYKPQIQWNGFVAEPVRSDSNEFEEILQQSAAHLGMPPINIGPSTGTSDMRHFCAAQIPCLLYGPGRGYNPHRPDEHYYLDDLPCIILFYLDVALAWCGAKPKRST